MTVQRIVLAPAYVIHRRPYRDSSLILDVLSRDHGRLALVARGVRRSRKGGSTATCLQPFAPLLLSWSQGRGEMGTFTSVEPGGAAARFVGEPLYAGFYANELLLRLMPLHDPHPELFETYRELLSSLADGAVASALRRFERILLESLGYGLNLTVEIHTGEPVQPERRYRYWPEQGPAALDAGAEAQGYPGRLLLDLARDQLTEADATGDARRLLAQALAPLLGDRPLHSRELLRQMRRTL